MCRVKIVIRSQFFQDYPLVLKILVGERYKGCISQPPLLVHSSVGKHLILAYMPHDPKGGCLLHSTTRLNLPI